MQGIWNITPPSEPAAEEGPEPKEDKKVSERVLVFPTP